MLTLVTGATGHVGANVVRQLLERGRRVRALMHVHNDTGALDGLDIERVHGDILDLESLERACAGVDTVHHLAARITLAYKRHDAAWETNVTGTRRVAEACVRCGVRRLVYYSSIHAFTAIPKHAVVDESRPRALELDAPIYDRSKAAAELEVLDAVKCGLDAVIVSPTAVIGPHDYVPSPMGRLFIDLYHRKAPALVAGGFNWVDARDVALGAIAAEERGRTGENYLLAGHYRTLDELAAMVQDVTGILKPRWTVPTWVAMAGLPFTALHARITGQEARFSRAALRAITHHQQISHEKAAQELGYAPRPLRQTIEDAYSWLRQAGKLHGT